MIRSCHCCCCIHEPVNFSHCVLLKLGHRFHALLNICSALIVMILPLEITLLTSPGSSCWERLDHMAQVEVVTSTLHQKNTITKDGCVGVLEKELRWHILYQPYCRLVTTNRSLFPFFLLHLLFFQLKLKGLVGKMSPTCLQAWY